MPNSNDILKQLSKHTLLLQNRTELPGNYSDLNFLINLKVTINHGGNIILLFAMLLTILFGVISYFVAAIKSVMLPKLEISVKIKNIALLI